MEEYSHSAVRQSLVRSVVMGSMPSQWLWANIISMMLLLAFVWFSIGILFALCVIPLGLIIHLFLFKAYQSDQYFFRVYFRYILQNAYIPSSSRVNYIE